MGSALISGLPALLGGLLLALTAAAAEPERVFLTEGYRYVPDREGIDENTAEIGLSLCGTRCNALSANYESYMMTMGWRLTRVEGSAERSLDLANPFLGGRCICTGGEYLAEFIYFRPGGPPAPGAKPQGAGGGPASGALR